MWLYWKCSAQEVVIKTNDKIHSYILTTECLQIICYYYYYYL